MFADENKSASLAEFLNDFSYVIIDTCSLMDPSFAVWMDVLSNAKEYRKKNQPIYILQPCYEELRKHAKDVSDDRRRIAALRELKILRKIRWQKLLSIKKIKINQNFADNVIYTVVSTDRIQNRILIITQDVGLAYDLRNLNALKSQRGREVSVYKFTSGGALAINKGESRFQKKRADAHKSGEENKPSPISPTKKKDDNLALIVANDTRLKANLGNETYSSSKKKEDIQNQLNLLSSLPKQKKEGMKLLLSESDLKEALERIDHPLPKEEKKAPVKEVKPAKATTPEPKPAKLWYEEGQSIESALINVGAHYGLMFRDASLSYLPNVHGPLDVTAEDLNQIAEQLSKKLANSSKAETVFKGAIFMAEPSSKGYKAWVDLAAVKPAIAKEEPKPKPAAPAKKPAEAKKKAAPATKKKAEPQEKKQKASPKQKPKEPAKKAPAKKSAPKQTAKEAALKADTRLRSVLGNPKYSDIDKANDIEEQISRLQHLPKAQREGFYYSVESLKETLAKLKK